MKARGRLAAAVLAVCSLPPACRIGPSLRSSPPTRPVCEPVAVLPGRELVDRPEVAAALAAATETALRARGYYVAPVDVVADLLEDRGFSRRRPPRAEDALPVLASSGVGAVVEVEVRSWRDVWAPRLLALEYDVVWRIVDVASKETIWRRRVADRWSWETELPVLDHDEVLGLYLGRRLEDEPGSPFRTMAQLTRRMARAALAALPPAAAD